MTAKIIILAVKTILVMFFQEAARLKWPNISQTTKSYFIFFKGKKGDPGLSPGPAPKGEKVFSHNSAIIIYFPPV